MSTPPDGWLECNGQSTTGYYELASLIGATVPDLRGVFIRGWDHDRGIDLARNFSSSQTDSMQSFKVASSQTQLASSPIAIGSETVGVGGSSGGGGPQVYLPMGAGSAFSFRPYGLDNSNTIRQSTETRPVNTALLPCIKY